MASHLATLTALLSVLCVPPGHPLTGQVLCARAVSRGQLGRARALLRRLFVRCSLLGVATAMMLLVLSGPMTALLVPADAATACATLHLFKWAALVTPIVAPNALCEAVLLGCGRSYAFLGFATLANALTIGGLTRAAIDIRPQPSSAWACITFFFLLRLACAMRRLRSPRSGLGQWEDDR